MDDRFFHHGGSLKPDSPSYIQRPADTELYNHIKARDFCYVLTTRQMGKSSLMARTAVRLKSEGCLTAIIDLTTIGGQEQNTDTHSWHYGILHQITREINKQLKQAQQPLLTFKDWWDANSELSSIQRFSEYFEDVLLAHTDKPITIFFDEIDSTITLPFTDDFFAAIRAFYNKRASDENYQRLGFVLLGVATPADLINDTRRTPFNIGQAIKLDDFTLTELKTLRDGFACDAETADTLLARIHHWTDGHPYLSQKLASLVQECTDATADTIDTLVSEHFLHTKATQNETNLKFVDNRITQDSKYRTPMLKLYRRILRGDAIADKPLSPIHNGLKLSGLVKLNANNNLKIRNRLYSDVFNQLWVTRNLRKDRTMLKAVSVAVSIVALGFSFWYFYLLPKTYIDYLTKNQDYMHNGFINNQISESHLKLSSTFGYSRLANKLAARYLFMKNLNMKDELLLRDDADINWSTPLGLGETRNYLVKNFIMSSLKNIKKSDSIEYRKRLSRIIEIYLTGRITEDSDKKGKMAVYFYIQTPLKYKVRLKEIDHGEYKILREGNHILRFRKMLFKKITRTTNTSHFMYDLIDFTLISQKQSSNSRLHCIDEACEGVKVTYADSPSEIIYFDARNYPPIEGDPDELLKEWSEKLGIDPDTL